MYVSLLQGSKNVVLVAKIQLIQRRYSKRRQGLLGKQQPTQQAWQELDALGGLQTEVDKLSVDNGVID